ncbi:class I SAM-dependent methyltransferase [Flexibacterium corallicola]|uniref:class I SAM-dependent methyltransferase n=1 Tax=Flexibacterium corallicola TaxID=3037259 RepID=UPI00286F0076|nr:class I SAM-dependent methyltransferase [Pseudovibrio sp. M1P-2-3]
MLDPALETLVLPVLEESIALPDTGELLFLRARMGPSLRQLPRERLVCHQTFAPDANALERSGFKTVFEVEGQFPFIMVLPPRQRKEARALLAQAVKACGEGGMVVAAISNTEGAKTCEADLKALAGLDGNKSKNKCRVFWTQISKETVNQDLLDEWLQLDSVHEIEQGRYKSRPGVFSWDHIDHASKLLVKHLPATLQGKGADFGAGLGYLSDEVLTKCPKVSGMDLVEAEKRALDLAKLNLSSAAKPVEFIWADVTATLKGAYDFIVMNPPFHTGKADRTDLGQAFIVSASKALKPAGSLWMVANRHLPYEHTLEKHFDRFEIVGDEGGFKIIHAVKARK